MKAETFHAVRDEDPNKLAYYYVRKQIREPSIVDALLWGLKLGATIGGSWFILEMLRKLADCFSAV